MDVHAYAAKIVLVPLWILVLKKYACNALKVGNFGTKLKAKIVLV